MSFCMTLFIGSSSWAMEPSEITPNSESCPADFQASFTFQSNPDCTFTVTGYPDTASAAILTYTWTVNNANVYSTGTNNVFEYESADNLEHLRLTVTSGGPWADCESTYALDMSGYTCENTTLNGPADIIVL